ncbi:MAG: maleylpyruvate isomerase [Syntrophorhabdales bacterium]|jgi:hypothetical protein
MDGKQLAESVRRKVKEFTKLCAGIDEGTASRAPAGRWSPKQIVSHLCGPEGVSPVSAFRVIIEKDIPEIHIEPGNPFFSDARSKTSFADLLREFEKIYEERADFIAGLQPEQLGRKGHIPALKDSPLGEYPTLGALVQGIGEYHLSSHIDHLREILAALGASPKS